MDSRDPQDLTRVLANVRQGDARAEKELFDRVYDELHRMAHQRMRHETPQQTLMQTTVLVNEAYLRLVRDEPSTWENRAHFFGAAAQAMRRILVDYARKRQADRRGGGAPKVPLHEELQGDVPRFDLLAVDEALDRLAELRPRAARVVGYRFYLGLSAKESADLLGVSTRTVEADWKFASAWLRREIEDGGHEAERRGS